MTQPFIVVGEDGQNYMVVGNEMGALPLRSARPSMQQMPQQFGQMRPMGFPGGGIQQAMPQFQRAMAMPSVVAPGPTLFPTIPSAQGNQLGSLPMGAGRITWIAGSALTQNVVTRPQRNFIGRRMIAIVTAVADIAGAALDNEVYISNFLVGAQFQLGNGEPLHTAAMAVNATGAGFTINSVEPGQDYSITAVWQGRVLAGDDVVAVSFTVYGDTVR